MCTWLATVGCAPPAGHEVQVWAAGPEAVLGAQAAPVLESAVFSESRGEIRLHTAINASVGFQLVMRAERVPAGPFTVELSDLAGPGGRLDSSELATIYRVQPVLVERFASWYPEHAGRPATPTVVPDILVPWDAPRGGGPIRFAQQGSEAVWVDLRVPPTIDPGEYRGDVLIRSVADQTIRWQCGLRLEVLPVALPATRSLAAICRVDPRDLLAAHLGWPRESAEQTRLLRDASGHQAAVRLVDATMRLFQEHGTTPVLWASFPKYRLVGARQVEIDWEPYDRLVSGWLNGSGFADGVALSHWAVPASLEHPSAEREGGIGSPAYARVLAAYLAECRRHFAERGWQERSFVRMAPPGELTSGNVAQVGLLADIVRQSEADLPVVAHLPAGSLRGLGWRGAPEIRLTGIDIWAPRAMWFEPQALQREQALGRRAWFCPDHPPYSSSLGSDGLGTDAVLAAWQAYRYQADAIWVERSAEFGTMRPAGSAWRSDETQSLVYPGSLFGLADRPVPSVRLKRLRQGLQDAALLHLLERRGKQALAQSLAGQVVRWAGTDACLDDLLTCKPTGWPRELQPLVLARELLLRELAADAPTAGPPAARSQQLLTEWNLLMNQATRVHAGVTGVRLQPAGDGLRAQVLCDVVNYTNHTITGRWSMPAPPVGWQPPADVPISLSPGARRAVVLEALLSAVPYNTSGAYPFDLVFDTSSLGAFAVAARLAVATCPPVQRPLTVDGDLSDWALAASNAAADFLLVNAGEDRARVAERRPARPTQAFFGMDREYLFVGVRCALAEGERPLWHADNLVPLDGAVPWGQDAVELLIDPRPAADGTSSDIFQLQIKPNGVVVERRGCRTEPPIGTSERWHSGARVAVSVQREAWAVELALPLAALGPGAAEQRVWGLNVTRLDARRGEYSSWSGARGHCYSPRTLGNLILLRP
jgi:hypothetical protein